MRDMIRELIRLFYNPPPAPPIDIPVILKVAKFPIDKALELFYLAGWYDGFVFGLVVGLMFLPSRRER